MAIKDRNKMHNLQHELIYLQQPEASFTGSLVPLSAVVRIGAINSNSKNGVIYSSNWRCY